MAEDFARLGMSVGSDGVLTADQRLVKLGKTAGQTERKTDKLGKTTTTATRRMSKGFGAAAKAAALAATAIVALGAAVRNALSEGGEARQFSRAIGEVSTLITGSAEQISFLESETRKLARTFGGTASAQAKSFYNILSAAGLPDTLSGLKQAAAILETSNKLSIGGITSVTKASKGLTNSLNIYKLEALTSAGISDTLFTVMKAGVTNVGELIDTMGIAGPIATQLGLSFDEVTAAQGALTKSGVSSNIAATGLRAIFAAILKPSGEAAKLAKNLVLEFNSQALAAKGLSGFLADVKDKTKGSSDAMAVLFGGVEAISPAMFLAGEGAGFYADILGDLDDKLGAADDALNKMQKTLDQRLTSAFGKFADKALGLKLLLLKGLTPAIEFLAEYIDFIGRSMKTMAIIAGGVLLGSMVGLTRAVTLFNTQLVITRSALIKTGFGAFAVLIGEVVFQLDKYFNSSNDAGKVSSALTDAVAVQGSAADKLALSLAAVNTGNKNSVIGAQADAQANLVAAQAARQRTIDEIGLARVLGAEVEAGLRRQIVRASANISDKNQFIHIPTATKLQLSVYEKVMGNLQGALKIANQELEDFLKPQRELEKLLPENAKQIEAIEAKILALSTATAEFDKTGIAQVWDEVSGTFVEVKKNGDAVQRTLKDLKGGANDLADALETSLTSAVGSVADAFGKFIVGGLRDFKSFAKSILSTFKNMIANMIATALKNKILISLGIGGTAAGATAASAAGTGVLGSLIGGFGSAGIAATATTAAIPAVAATGLLGGVGGTVAGLTSGFAAGGVGGAVSGVFGAASAGVSAGLAAGGLAGIGAAIGAAIPIIGAAVAIFSFFKKTRKVTDRRLEIVFNDDGVTAQSATDILTKRFFGLSKKRTTEYKKADDDFVKILTTFNHGSREALSNLGQTFGVNNALDGFTTELKFSIKGLNQKQAIDLLTQKLGEVREKMAALVVGSKDFVREGETFQQAAARMAAGITAVNISFDALGLRMFDISREGANAASGLAEILGGLQGFASATQFYFTNFFSTTERLNINTKTLTDTLALLGVNEVPRTRIAFRGLVQQMQEIGNTGAVGALLKIAPLFIEIAGAADEAAQANARLFRTRADEVFARSGPVAPFNRDGSGDRIASTAQTQEEILLRELLTEIRNGHIVLARNTGKTAQILDRTERRNEIA